jgi:hypothetical protein
MFAPCPSWDVAATGDNMVEALFKVHVIPPKTAEKNYEL